MKRLLTLGAGVMLAVAAWAAYDAPELEKIDQADLEKFKEAYTYYQEGVEYEKEASWASASAAYRHAVETYPNYADAQYGFGRMALRLGRLDEAEQALKYALALNPDLYQAHSELGNVHYRREEYNKAAYEFQEVLKKDAKDPVARYNFANALRKLGQPEKAVDQYEKALVLDPENIDCYFNMGLAYEDLDKFEEAIANYQKFIDVAKDDPDETEYVKAAREYIKELQGKKGQ